MEVDEKPTEDYSDIGGLDKQIQELVEAIVLPVTHKVRMHAVSSLVISCSPAMFPSRCRGKPDARALSIYFSRSDALELSTACP